RKRGTFPDPQKRVFINDAVCEGCGDCSVKSNCVSVQPLETEFGRKRQIDQSNCNKDYSCVNGFCPSFVTVHGGGVRKAKKAGPAQAGDALFDNLPAPRIPSAAEPYGILITGIGGTGVVTIGALLGMASHIEGKGVSVLDMAGLAQKNGAVTSHIRIADNPDDLHAVRIATGGSKLLLGCDIVVAAGAEALATLNQGVSSVVANSYVVPTASFIADQALDFRAEGMVQRLKQAAGEEHAHFVDATRLATALMGDSIATNLFMLGYAFQKGLVPLSEDSLMRAVEINGVAVEANRRAFALGRLAAHDPAAVQTVAEPLMRKPEVAALSQSFDELVTRRVGVLTDYQDAAYAARYKALVDTAAAAERERTPGMEGFAEAVAKNFFKLMAYKDEYEVARLYTSGDFLDKLNRQFEGDFTLRFHLAPPLFARRDPDTGELQKREYGPWVFRAFRLLAAMRRLRGTAFDIFGHTEERCTERRLIGEYESLVREIVAGLDHDRHPLAVQLAEVPERIKGFGHVKERNLTAAKAAEAELLAAFRSPAQRASAAE
ncbi:MAG TPA: DUF6537 domain-containing protein, partial [Alphaproteobacteria bacterium]|nr:DUF6537 domain-containing protein [Alphaproteobacteria bacterium]